MNRAEGRAAIAAAEIGDCRREGRERAKALGSLFCIMLECRGGREEMAKEFRAGAEKKKESRILGR